DDRDILVKAIKREIKEEIGLQVEAGSVQAIHATSGYNEQKNLLILAIGYICKTELEQAVKLSEEHSEYKWVSVRDFKKLDIGDDGGLILSILEKVFKIFASRSA
ncbi:MAG: NUDIX domain-containing protein, partial [bacterium]|nr:NUDIX domain-containing protein [bacterium]